MTEVLRLFDPWNSPLCTCPRKYSLHPYTGCSHMCLYCYATAYIGRRPSTPKRDFLRRLARDLRRADPRLPVELSSSSDPYPPEEMGLGLTRSALKLLKASGFRTLITTKGTGFTRDLDLIDGVMVTITTLDRELAKKIEPNAPSPEDRLRAIEEASQIVRVGIRLDPIIPGLNDDREGLREVLQAAKDAGAEHVVTSTYKARPDNFRRMINAFPGLASMWRRLYYEEGERISGYRYLKRERRRELMSFVVSEALKLGMSAATCREGFPDLLKAKSCDGTHLTLGKEF